MTMKMLPARPIEPILGQMLQRLDDVCLHLVPAASLKQIIQMASELAYSIAVDGRGCAVLLPPSGSRFNPDQMETFGETSALGKTVAAESFGIIQADGQVALRCRVSILK
jgi:hypothetical protein